MSKKLKIIMQKGNGNYLVNELMQAKKDFVVTKTVATTKVQTDNTIYLFTPNIISVHNIHWFTKIKKEVEAGIINNPVFNRDKQPPLKYFDFTPSLYDFKKSSGSIYEIKNITEIDLTAAYYKAAHNLNLISDNFYNSCLTIPKSLRLTLLGSIAKKKRIYTYQNGEKTNYEIDENTDLRHAWKIIVSHVGEVMEKAKFSIKDDFIFYWVDGIYFKNINFSNSINIKNIFNEYNFTYKEKRIKSINIINCGNELKIETVEKPKGRLFCLPQEKIKGYYFDI